MTYAICCDFMESRYLDVKSVLENRLLMVSRVLEMLSANAFR
ncbi:unnamed protein product [marine sediment metagenome]|uniref:Uncharacterized protein n=1 Tax=marine sediment metagenome TaxID=412755 RepID=X0Z0J3_9ZZZZ